MNCYLFFHDERMYLGFGASCTDAADHLGAKIGVNSDDFSVGGSWPIMQDQPLEFLKEWPHFQTVMPK